MDFNHTKMIYRALLLVSILLSACGGGGESSVSATGTSPAISSFTPTSGAAGTAVTIAGTNFSATAANNTVSFNSTPATITSASATQIVATVPATATNGAITVTTGGSTATSATSFTVTAATGDALTLTGPFNSIPSLTFNPNSPVITTAAYLGWDRVPGNPGATPGASAIYLIQPDTEEMFMFSGTPSTGNSFDAGGIPLAYSLWCHLGGPNTTSIPTCASWGITFSRSSGTITFAATPVIENVNFILTGTMTGTLSFTPF